MGPKKAKAKAKEEVKVEESGKDEFVAGNEEKLLNYSFVFRVRHHGLGNVTRSSTDVTAAVGKVYVGS